MREKYIPETIEHWRALREDRQLGTPVHPDVARGLLVGDVGEHSR